MVSKAFPKFSSFKALSIPFAVVLIPFSGIAGEGDPVAAAQGSGLLTIDWIIIAAYACSTILLGWWFARKQKDTREYFIGSGNMNPMLNGVSRNDRRGPGPGFLSMDISRSADRWYIGWHVGVQSSILLSQENCQWVIFDFLTTII